MEQGTSKYTCVRLVKSSDGVAEVILSRGEKLNTMTPAFFDEIGQVFQRISKDPSIRVVILWAEGKIFSAGLDMKEAASLMGESSCQASANMALYERIRHLQQSFDSIRTCKQVVIGAIHGKCIGGAVDLITACDFCVCTEDAEFSVRETKIAIVADLGTLQRLHRIIGRGATREICFTGDNYGSDWALKNKLVNHVYKTKDQMLETTRKFAQSIASNSPLTLRGVKHVLNYSEDHNLQDSLEHIALYNSAFLKSEDLQEAMMSFLEKRPPKFVSKL
eukprot:TRINITY_DN446_c0_g3_i1.p1 TRINITY_DN446_c0_g3~~TRINITY_DN446_c0_g3_i1.p1  ORF type:complete len:277 (+),score=32.59 TRINITY_DN446_c0_g3_i1:111-941(+)